MSAKQAKQLRRAAMRIANEMPLRRMQSEQVQTVMGTGATRQVNDPQSYRGIYRTLKKSAKRS